MEPYYETFTKFSTQFKFDMLHIALSLHWVLQYFTRPFFTAYLVLVTEAADLSK